MPIHDWTREDEGVFHAFHLAWSVVLSESLNNGLLPDDCSALVARSMIYSDEPPDEAARYHLPFADPSSDRYYVLKRKRIDVRHGETLVATVDFVVPGMKVNGEELRRRMGTIGHFARTERVSSLILDLFPPSRFDPDGVPGLVAPNAVPAMPECGGRSRCVASYQAGDPPVPKVRWYELGDALEDADLHVGAERPVRLPLQSSYDRALGTLPSHLRRRLQVGMPDATTDYEQLTTNQP